MANTTTALDKDLSKLHDTSWPGSFPHKEEKKLISVVCGNSHINWAVHEGSGNGFMPMLFWRTQALTEDDINNHDPCKVLERFLPNGGHEVIFGTSSAPPEKAQAAKASAGRRIPTLSVYVVTTNEDNEAGIQFLFRDIPCRMHRMKAEDFFTPKQGAYPTIGIDRLACLKACANFYDFPVMVIDGGTALTYTAADPGGNIIGGGIAQGLASKFRSMHDHTGALPLIEYNAFMDMIDTAEKEKKPLSSFASDTKSAMVVAGLTETAHLCCGAVAKFRKACEDYKRDHPSDSSTIMVCITGGDGDVIAKLLQADHSGIIEVDPDSQYSTEGITFHKHKHLAHYGIAAILKNMKEARETVVESDVDKVRSTIVGQRVAKRFRIRGSEDLFRGTVAAITSGKTLDDDWFFVRYDDGDTEHLGLVSLYDALVMYTEVGETFEPDELTTKKLEEAKETAAVLMQNSAAVKTHSEIPIAQRDANPLGNRKRPSKGSAEKPKKSKKIDPRSYLNTRVAKYFGDDVFFGTVTTYTPSSLTNDNELWHVLYDDDDEEDYDLKDMRSAKTLYAQHEHNDPKRNESKVDAVDEAAEVAPESADVDMAEPEPPTAADSALPPPAALDGDALP